MKLGPTFALQVGLPVPITSQGIMHCDFNSVKLARCAEKTFENQLLQCEPFMIRHHAKLQTLHADKKEMVPPETRDAGLDAGDVEEPRDKQ